jgi:hypothetical protein
MPNGLRLVWFAAAAIKTNPFPFTRSPHPDSFKPWLGCGFLAGMLDKIAFDPLYNSLAVELAHGYGQDRALRVIHACLQLEAVQKREGAGGPRAL